MKILHYALGFPPYRNGGLTKFCVDLMVQQIKEGHHVAMLWPGQMRYIRKRVTIIGRSYATLIGQKIQSFEIINPLPVSLDEGIADFKAFTTDAGKLAYEIFLDNFQPDVIHVHTLMGLHKSFINAARHRGIRLVFTAHDFFPICPKVTMFRHGAICGSVENCTECGACNTTALSLKKIRVLQSPIYRYLKNCAIVKKLRKRHRDGFLSENTLDDTVKPVGTTKNYKNLREYYYSLLKLMDIIHYNSTITKQVYESVFRLPNNCMIGITHADISDNRIKKQFCDDRIRIRYLGPQGGSKGFFLLKMALDELWSKQQNFCLDVHFTPTEMSLYIKAHERYSYGDLKAIFDDTDLLVAPSIWYETFGFTVLEALSYGVPVVISDTVGAKDILAEGAGIIIEDINAERLCAVLQSLNAQILKKMNKAIIDKQIVLELSEMSEQIEEICYGRNC